MDVRAHRQAPYVGVRLPRRGCSVYNDEQLTEEVHPGPVSRLGVALASSYRARSEAALAFQLNCLARARAAAERPSRSSWLRDRRSIASAQASTFSGAKRMAASPATSGIDVQFDATVGAPNCIPSNTGSPN